ncbi:MAG: TMEM165/GDT1 family protein [Firmicutes bacterium]|nr:TMEM165/GDT1 family protein [Bacillota bacterium]
MVWRAFFTTFGLVFLAELGDKTQLTTMLMAAQSKLVWPVFFGSVLALACSSFICVVAGSVIMRYIAPQHIRLGAGVAFLLIGALLLVGKG